MDSFSIYTSQSNLSKLFVGYLEESNFSEINKIIFSEDFNLYSIVGNFKDHFGKHQYVVLYELGAVEMDQINDGNLKYNNYQEFYYLFLIDYNLNKSFELLLFVLGALISFIKITLNSSDFYFEDDVSGRFYVLDEFKTSYLKQ